MKYLDLAELAKVMANKTGCSLENAERFLDAQDHYFDEIGVNTTPGEPTATISPAVVVNDEEMMNYIMNYTGMSESFARRLADAERASMEEQGFISESGTLEPFMKGRGKR